MSPIFPNNPAPNQAHTTAGRVYRWSGKAWEFASVGASGNLAATVTVPGSGDQYWDATLLLLKGDGGLVDSSSYGRAVTAYGSAAAITSASKWGTGSVLINGSGSALSVPQSDFNFIPSLADSWTVETWIYPLDFSAYRMLWTHGYQGGNDPAAYILVNVDTGILSAGVIATGATQSVGFASSTALTLNTWQHVALVYDAAAGTLKGYINGVNVGSGSKPSGASWGYSSNGMWIGNYADSGNRQTYGINSRLDDFRITKAARYSANFTPPTATYVTGAYTAPQTLPVSFTGGTSPVLADDRWNLLLPPAPTGLTATAGNAQVSLSWTAPSATYIPPITDYVVQFKEASASTWNTFSDGTSTATSATVTGLTNGTAYVVRVAAVNGVGTGAYTAATSNVTPVDAATVSYLVVAGGGGGGACMGGGGGGGGFLSGTTAMPRGTANAIVIGGGGAKGALDFGTDYGQNGSSSSLLDIVASGGGGGDRGGNGSARGKTGGSGGGSGEGFAGGLGISGQGNNGGSGVRFSDAKFYSGGGGGAGAVGGSGDVGIGPGNGGDGSLWNGSYYAGGGGAGGRYQNNADFDFTPGNGGQGGGGRGGITYYDYGAVPGTYATGGGGGGGGAGSTVNLYRGENGGSGVVILRTLATAASTTGSPTVTQDGSYNVYTFTGSGSITF